MTITSRRRFIALTAAAAGVALLPGGAAFQGEPLRWKGDALGADASLELYVPDRAAGRRILAECLAELERLERIFSLYRNDSELVRLNRAGWLDGPALELVDLLSVSRSFSIQSDGAFDVTVQPLWELYANHFSQPDADPLGPPEAAIAAVRRLVDWRDVSIDAGRISLARRGMGVTLNGIAQGYVTDKVAELLRHRGMRHVLVDMGEIRALDGRPDGSPWPVQLEGGGRVGLVDRAVSTSAPDGTRFSPACNHIFVPSTGHSTTFTGTVSVIARSTTVADALSTACAVGGPSFARTLAERIPGVEILFGGKEGTA